MQAPVRQSFQAGSIDEFNETMKSAGWDLEFMQLDRGAKTARAATLATPNVVVLEAEFNNKIHQRGIAPQGYFTFGMPSRHQPDLYFGAREVASESMMVLTSPSGFDAVTESGYTAYTVSIADQHLQDVCQRLAPDNPEKLLPKPGAIFAPDADLLIKLRRNIAGLFAERDNTANTQHLECAMIEDELVSAAVCISAAEIPDRSSFAARQRALLKARDYIAANGATPITVLDICAAAACSLSTLQRAFREHYGVSPKRYLLAFKLSGLRKSLLLNEAATVKEAAARWGFWHAGKLSQDYHAMFGELPSATLKRTVS